MKTFLLLAGVALLLGLVFSPVPSALLRYLAFRASLSGAAIQGDVDADGVRIHFRRYGSGPAVLLLHGGLGSRWSWFSQIPPLVESGRTVVVPDVRGHGFSGLGRRELNYRLLARDAIRVMDRLRIGRADVVGWSDGGNTALLMGKEWPERVRRLVLVSANFNPSGLTPEMLEDTYAQSSGPALWFKRWWTGAGARFQALERRVKRMWRTCPNLEPDDLLDIEAPVLVIVGRRDAVSVSHARKMVATLPHAELLVLPGGHATPITHSKQVNSAIAAFLDQPIPGKT